MIYDQSDCLFMISEGKYEIELEALVSGHIKFSFQKCLGIFPRAAIAIRPSSPRFHNPSVLLVPSDLSSPSRSSRHFSVFVTRDISTNKMLRNNPRRAGLKALQAIKENGQTGRNKVIDRLSFIL